MPSSFTRLSRGEFLKVFKRGRRVASPSFQCIYVPSEVPDTLAVAIVVSKKIAKGAVGRNLVRRRMYHALRDAVTHVGPIGGACIVMVRSQALTLGYEDLVHEYMNVLSRAFGRPQISR